MSRAIVEQTIENKKLKALIINTFSLYVVSNKWCHSPHFILMQSGGIYELMDWF